MKIAILSCGPSLETTWAASAKDHDLVIAVNRAGYTHECDWFVAYDAHPIKTCTLRPRVGLYTLGGHLLALDGGAFKAGWGEWEGVERVEYKELCDRIPIKDFRKWSAIGALGLAWHLGGEDVEVFGADMAGATYCDGAPMAGSPAHRFAREGKAFHDVTAWLASEHGVTVTRAALPRPAPGEEESAAGTPPDPVVPFGALSIPERRACRRLYGKEMHAAGGSFVLSWKQMTAVQAAAEN